MTVSSGNSTQAPDGFCLLTAAASHRMWALQRLRKLLTTEFGQSINIHRLLGDHDAESRALVRSGARPDAGPVGRGVALVETAHSRGGVAPSRVRARQPCHVRTPRTPPPLPLPHVPSAGWRLI